eukprot:5496449-Pyramimonas_sp.AAC.1
MARMLAQTTRGGRKRAYRLRVEGTVEEWSRKVEKVGYEGGCSAQLREEEEMKLERETHFLRPEM